MKVKVDLPLDVLKTATTQQINRSIYDNNGNYLNTEIREKIMLTIYVPSYQDQPNPGLMKLTKRELVEKLKTTYYSREIEVIQ